MTKVQVIEALKVAGIKFDENSKYNDLHKLLKSNKDKSKPPPARTIRLENRMAKRNVFLADSFRSERDAAILNAEIGKREHKGKIVCITTIKHMVVTPEGDWLTEFIIDLKQ